MLNNFVLHVRQEHRQKLLLVFRISHTKRMVMIIQVAILRELTLHVHLIECVITRFITETQGQISHLESFNLLLLLFCLVVFLNFTWLF